MTSLLAPDPIRGYVPPSKSTISSRVKSRLTSDLEITFFNPADTGTLLTSTLAPDQRNSLAAILRAHPPQPKETVDLEVGRERLLVTHFHSSAEGGAAGVLLQRSLDKELAPYLSIERTYLLLALAGLLISIGVGIWDRAQRF